METDIETDIVAWEAMACARRGRSVVAEVRRWWRSQGLSLLQGSSISAEGGAAGLAGAKGGGGAGGGGARGCAVGSG